MNEEVAMERLSYDDAIVKKFVIATILWGFVSMLVGVLIASQLAYWPLNFGIPWLTFGRLRPLHTNAAIFAFAGNAVFAGIYYSTQRLLKARMFSDALSKIHFWGWQAVIVLAALTLPLGYTVGKEYAELEWPIVHLITIIWVVFAVNFFGTLVRRREKHLYVALWFYIATIVTVAVLHIVNKINLPVSLWKSYPVYSGVQDAMVQWWYGHNAVAFFLTTPFLGLMYYFLPKAAERPVYSYKLSIVHFWSLVFIYIWAGPHHLLNTALPEWAQTLGMIFSIMLLAPSWGGMINGLLTLRGAWDRLRTDPILKFLVAGVTFYGMSTFEGPMLSIKSVNSLAHYTDWIIAHVHGGTLGWNGFITFGMIYWLVPRLWKTRLHSVALATAHFWLGLFGMLVYITSMWAAGVTQGLMWRAVDASGHLVYPDFIETVVRIVPLYWIRAFGGLLYLSGVASMIYNVWMTVDGAPEDQSEDVFSAPALRPSSLEISNGGNSHRFIEGLPLAFTVLALVAILVGTLIELVPSFLSGDYVALNPPAADGSRKINPYTPLELAGRDIYVREGCYLCHSQQVRTLKADYLRYGEPSRTEESMYDHPFQWGSRRIGPDLSRVGGKYPDLWHFRHLNDPREIVKGSIMPRYLWLAKDRADLAVLKRKLKVMRQIGVPYSEADIDGAEASAKAQAARIAEGLESQGGPKNLEDKEIVAVIAYLQRLGSDLKKSTIVSTAPAGGVASGATP